MKTSDMIRQVCEQMNISISELARRLGQSPQNFGTMFNSSQFLYKKDKTPSFEYSIISNTIIFMVYVNATSINLPLS